MHEVPGSVKPVSACLRQGLLHAGSVTPLPQAGNPKPRAFRLPELGYAPQMGREVANICSGRSVENLTAPMSSGDHSLHSLVAYHETARAKA